MEGLRGLAVLLVYFVHLHSFFAQYVSLYPRLYAVSEYMGRIGNSGVDLFFVLSGFIIYGALVHKPVSYLSFLRRRVERIYPTFLAVLSSYLVLSMVFPSESKIPGHTWAAAKYIVENIFLLPGFFPIVPIVTVAWSLSFEFAFYLTVPIAVVILYRCGNDSRHRIALLAGMWGIFLLSQAFLFHGTHIRMLSFLTGMLLQEVTASGSFRAYLTRRGQWLSVLCLGLIVSYHFAIQSKVSSARGEVLSLALMSVAIFFFALYSLEYPGGLRKVCTWSPIRYWGNVSYSYYLAHGVTLKALAKLLAWLRPEHHSVVIYFTALVVGLAATWVSAGALYLVVEKPMSLTHRKEVSVGAAVLASLPWLPRKDRAATGVAGSR